MNERFTFATNEKWFLFDNETEDFMDMEDCKDKLNEQQSTIKQQEKIIKEQTLRTYCQDKEIQKLLQQIKELKEK